MMFYSWITLCVVLLRCTLLLNVVSASSSFRCDDTKCQNGGRCLLVSNSSHPLGGCAKDREGNWCFKFNNQTLTDSNHARDLCKAYGVGLASLETAEKVQFITEKLQNLFNDSDIQLFPFQFWINGIYNIYTGKWLWVGTAKPIDWTLLPSGKEPVRTDNSANCLYLEKTNAEAKVCVRAARCDEKRYLVCEKKSPIPTDVPAPGPIPPMCRCYCAPDESLREDLFAFLIGRCCHGFFLYKASFQCDCPDVQCGSRCQIPNDNKAYVYMIPDLASYSDDATSINITCPAHQPGGIFIEFVFHGKFQFQGYVLSLRNLQGCYNDTALHQIKKKCNGKTQCQIPLREYPCHDNTKTGVKIRWSCGTTGEKFCEETLAMGHTWPRAESGREVVLPCPSGRRGEARWTCGEDGSYQPKEGPDMSTCRSHWSEEIQKKVDTGTVDPLTILQEIESELVKDDNIAPGDIGTVVDALSKSIERSQEVLNDMSDGKTILDGTFNITSVLLGPKGLPQWKGIPVTNRVRNVFLLMTNLESSAGFLPYHNTSSFVRETDEIVLDVNDLVISGPGMVTARFPTRPSTYIKDSAAASLNLTLTDTPYATAPTTGDGKDLVTDPVTTQGGTHVVVADDTGTKTRVVFVLYNNIQSLMTATISNSKDSNREIVANSPVLTASHFHADVSTNTSRREIQYVMKKTTYDWNRGESSCVFLDINNGSGAWSTDGCVLVSANETHATCSCDHLTNFAVLLDVHGKTDELSVAHTIALDVITYFGCTISIICLVLVIVIFSFFRGLWCPRRTIHRNLCICLCLGEVIFMSGIDKTQNRIACGIIAGFLHYAFLSAFAWMCLEGVEIYQMLVRVLRSKDTNVLWYYAAGYGVPLVVVLMSASINPGGYGTVNSCWLSTESGLIWSFAGPVAAICLANVVVLGICIRILYNNGRKSTKGREPVMKKLGVAVRGAVILLFLLGLTWFFGFLYIGNSTVVFAYIFTIFNSAQGVFIFTFQCATNEKVQQHVSRWARRTKLLPQSVRSRLSSHSGPPSSLSPAKEQSTGPRRSRASRFLSPNVEVTGQESVTDRSSPRLSVQTICDKTPGETGSRTQLTGTDDMYIEI